MLVLGYDPGGRGKHGVAAIRIGQSGSVDGCTETATFPTAVEVIEWISRFNNVAAFGVDTLLAWCPTGSRQCDETLRQKYRATSNSIVSQNSLYSSMTLNGAMVAIYMAQKGVPLCESHPKLVIKAAWPDTRGKDAAVRLRSQEMANCNHDHTADALVAAMCAAFWVTGRWTLDLYQLAGTSAYHFPAGRAVYPWPEAIG